MENCVSEASRMFGPQGLLCGINACYRRFGSQIQTVGPTEFFRDGLSMRTRAVMKPLLAWRTSLD